MPSYTRLLAMASACGVLLAPSPALAQSSPTPRTWTLEELVQRNVGSKERRYRAATPHKVIDNIWYVGTESLASFLVTTPAGRILINSSDEGNVPTILASVEKLGFKASDLKINFNKTLDAQRKGAAK